MPRYPVRPPDAAQIAQGGVTAVDRALTLLTAFRDADSGLTLSELAERAQLVPSTVLRLLASLAHFGFVQKRGDGTYALGSAAAQLYRVYVASFNLQDAVLPVLQALAARTLESASFHVRQGDHRLVLYRVNSPMPLIDQSRAGDLLPLDRGTGGHVLLAFEGEPGAPYDEVRKAGYSAAAISDRSPELAGISAPVFDAEKKLRGAVTLTMPAQRYGAQHIPVVREAADQLTRLLGGNTKPFAA
ncbi:IclR family transcriptional regulator [Candidimonas nitroreducens]|uniref:IclR family transcriptional regulator n=1 Tax=Candidimonas nitroreducens TaxID=683354 RepID=A0A225MQR4_9BURK|nr:IclR family transcriptional regulator [Candidimonas nitroreducens]OWT63707.1 IclR family transcriptional regulator [Candidimonas nitroreducens]